MTIENASFKNHKFCLKIFFTLKTSKPFYLTFQKSAIKEIRWVTSTCSNKCTQGFEYAYFITIINSL